jgi:hypothetical protein
MQITHSTIPPPTSRLIPFFLKVCRHFEGDIRVGNESKVSFACLFCRFVFDE